jgi:hypothetical protein
MRKFLLAALLLSAASPALALQDGDGGFERRSDRGERSERSSRKERSERAESRQQRNADGQRAAEMRRERAAVEAQGHAADAPVHARRGPDGQGDQQQAQAQRDSVREWRARERQRADGPAEIQDRNLGHRGRMNNDGLVKQSGQLPPVFDRNRVSREGRVSDRPRIGTQPPPPRTASTRYAQPTRHWSSDWRRDRRYNWYDWRRRNRHLFRIGFYSDPFGWGYQRYSIGWRLWPSYYGRHFWMDDPWMYRLPPAYGPYRWVRYYDDALLVNIYTGQVVDVEYNFFW